MGNMKLSAQRIGQRVNGRCPAGGNGDPAIIGCQQHGFLGIHVLRIAVSFHDVVENQARAFPCIEVTERSGLQRCVALHSMGQRIHSCSSYDSRRQMADHFRVQNSIIRDHFVIDDSFFYAFLWNGNDRVAGGLRAGPAGGRQKHCFDLLMGQRGITQKVLYGIRSRALLCPLRCHRRRRRSCHIAGLQWSGLRPQHPDSWAPA